MMQQDKKILTLPQIINLSLGTLGILFAWELEIANVSGIYSFFGANTSDLGYLWLAPSIIGLIIPLIIGYLSDRTSTSFGKRLPYIFWGAAVTSLCMLWLPNSSSLFIAVILVCAFTACINASLQPFRPLVADVVVEQEHTKVYAIQAALIGIGATVSSVLPWLLLYFFGHQSGKANVPFEIKCSFYIGAIIIFATCFWTTITSKKYLPKSDEIINVIKPIKNKKTLSLKNMKALFSSIPKVMWQVSAVQFFTWSGVFCFIIYLTTAIEQAIFHAPVGINYLHQVNDNSLLEKSVVLNGVCCAVYMAVNIIYAYIIPYLSKMITRKKVHVLSLLIGGLSLISFVFIHHTPYLMISMIGIGIAWASFNSIPFAMVAGSIPSEKLGVYMGLFNVAICLPQIMVSLCVGVVFKTLLHNNAPHLIVLSGAFMLFASLLTTFVKDKIINEVI